MTAFALRELARALAGDVVGGRVCCPGPNHSRSDRSLAVRPAPSMPDGIVVLNVFEGHRLLGELDADADE